MEYGKEGREFVLGRRVDIDMDICTVYNVDRSMIGLGKGAGKGK